jgi:hypothetical protein
MSVEYYATDKSNNQTTKKILAVYKDTTPPTITYRVENGYIDSDGTIVLGVNGKIIFTIEDDRALGKFYYRIDQGNWQEIPLQGKKQDVTISL